MRVIAPLGIVGIVLVASCGGETAPDSTRTNTTNEPSGSTVVSTSRADGGVAPSAFDEALAACKLLETAMFDRDARCYSPLPDHTLYSGETVECAFALTAPGATSTIADVKNEIARTKAECPNGHDPAVPTTS